MNAEERLWNYIDGTCSEDEQKAIDILIAQDEVYQRKYQELLSLDQQFSKIAPDEPSMAFTYKVMEGIRAEHAKQPLKAGINPLVIKGIAAFFILTILLLVIFVLSTLHLSAVNLSGHLPDNLKLPNMKNYLTGPVIKGFLFFDVVLGLFLFDAYLRKRNMSKQV
jgi:tetrahydromethanopterin S-methyltransferase subunit F